MATALKTSLSSLALQTGNAVQFFIKFCKNIFAKGFEKNEFLRQCYLIGNKSLGIVVLTGFIIGFVLTLQAIPTLKDFGAINFVPSMVSTSIIREIGPIITALICSGKIASGIGAELGSMRVTEQIDAMEISGVNYIKYLVVTRILACILVIPILTLIADAVGIFGGYIGLNTSVDMTLSMYFKKSVESLIFIDIIPSFIKTILFGFIIGFVGCYKGIFSNGGTESVGEAAKSAVVVSSIWIIVIDAMVVQIINILYY